MGVGGACSDSRHFCVYVHVISPLYQTGLVCRFLYVAGAGCAYAAGVGDPSRGRGASPRSLPVHALPLLCSRFALVLFYLPRGNVRLWLQFDSVYYLSVMVNGGRVFLSRKPSRRLVIDSLKGRMVCGACIGNG